MQVELGSRRSLFKWIGMNLTNFKNDSTFLILSLGIHNTEKKEIFKKLYLNKSFFYITLLSCVLVNYRWIGSSFFNSKHLQSHSKYLLNVKDYVSVSNFRIFFLFFFLEITLSAPVIAKAVLCWQNSSFWKKLLFHDS